MSYSNPQIGYTAGSDIVPTPSQPTPNTPSAYPNFFGNTGDRSGAVQVASLAGDTTLIGDRSYQIPAGAFIAIGSMSGTCEIKQVQSLIGNRFTFAKGLYYPHNPSERIELIPSIRVPYWLFGLVADGVTDDSRNMQMAALQFGGGLAGDANNLIFDGMGQVFAISRPICWPNNTARENLQWVISANTNFFPADCDNQMVIELGSGYPAPNTFTVNPATNVVTFLTSTALGNGTNIMFWNTNGLTGAIEGRIYYACNVVGQTCKLASTLALAIANTSDVAITGGTGNVFAGMNDIGISFVKKEYIFTALNNTGVVGVPGVNGYRRNGEQPGFYDDGRWNCAMPCYPPGTGALLNAGTGTGAGVTTLQLRSINPTGTAGWQGPLVPNGTQLMLSAGSVTQLVTLTADLHPGDLTATVSPFTPVMNFPKPYPPTMVQAPPVVLSTAGGGTIPAGNYGVVVTYVNFLGESLASITMSIAVGANGTLTIPSPPAMTNNSDTNVKSSNATGWYAYVTQAGQFSFFRQQAAGSPTAIGTPLVITANPTTTGAQPPLTPTAGAYLAWLSAVQYRYRNLLASICDTAIIAEGLKIADIIGRLDTEQITAFGIRTMGPNFMAKSGQGIFGLNIDGIHNELGNSWNNIVFDLTNNGSPAGLYIKGPYTGRGSVAGFTPVGTFINNPNGVTGIEIAGSPIGALPGAAGYSIITDPVNGNRDAWTDYAGQIVPIKIPPQPSAGGKPIRDLDVVSAVGASQLAGLVLRRVAINDVNYTQKAGDTYIGITNITAARNINLLSAGLYGGAMIMLWLVDESGLVTAVNKVTLTPKAGETINGSGAAFNALTSARASCLVMGNGSTNWTVIVI